MRIRLALFLSQTLLFLSGAALLLAAVFAVPLGIDNDAGWGRGRIFLAAAGGALLLAAGLLRAHRCWMPAFKRLVDGLRRPVAQVKPASPIATALFAFGGALLAILIFTFYLSGGNFSHWPESTRYFDRLADAFLAGQTALLEQPGPDLTSLDNPYDYHNREGVHYLWDASYYQGNYYLYWGPMPAVLAAAVKRLFPGMVSDAALVGFFVSGSILMLASILRLLHRRLFPRQPAWTLAALVCLGGLAAPVLWLAGRPSVYEVAIAGGQFFLLLGLYGALRSGWIWPEPHPAAPAWLALAAFGLGAAVACRLTLAPAVLVLALFLAIPILRRSPDGPARLRKLLWFGMPLALIAAGLLAYNYVRFGDLLETGHRYQLTGPALPADYGLVTSARYILPSLYGYLARPLHFSGEFPFVFAPFVTEQMWPFFIRLPEHYYYAEPLAGLPAVLPALWLGLLPLFCALAAGWNWLNERASSTLHVDFRRAWWLSALASGALLAPLLVFISTSLRYLADVTWLATLLIALGWWWTLHALRAYPLPRKLLLWAGSLLLIASILLSLLLNFNGPESRIELNNPALHAAVRAFFE